MIGSYLQGFESLVTVFDDNEIVKAMAIQQRNRVPAMAARVFDESTMTRELKQDLSLIQLKLQGAVPHVIRVQSRIRGYLERKANADKLKNARMRRKAATEILTTERSYIKCIDVLINSFKKPLEAEVKKGREPPVCTEDDVRDLFSNIEIIRGFNIDLLHAFEERINHWSPVTCIGDLFYSRAPYFKFYTQVRSCSCLFLLLIVFSTSIIMTVRCLPSNDAKKTLTLMSLSKLFAF